MMRKGLAGAIKMQNIGLRVINIPGKIVRF